MKGTLMKLTTWMEMPYSNRKVSFFLYKLKDILQGEADMATEENAAHMQSHPVRK